MAAVLKVMERPRFYSPVAMEDVVKHNIKVLAGEAEAQSTLAVIFENTLGQTASDFKVKVGETTFASIEGRVVVPVVVVEGSDAEVLSYEATAEGYETITGTVTPDDVNTAVYLRWAPVVKEYAGCCCCNGGSTGTETTPGGDDASKA